MKPKDSIPPEDEDPAAEEIAEAVNGPDLGTQPAEIDDRTENLTAWDDPPAAHGTAAPKFPLDDENNIGAELVEEGNEEADRDRRVAAADPDFEG